VRNCVVAVQRFDVLLATPTLDAADGSLAFVKGYLLHADDVPGRLSPRTARPSGEVSLPVPPSRRLRSRTSIPTTPTKSQKEWDRMKNQSIPEPGASVITLNDDLDVRWRRRF
jgi:hypothetical protein